MILYNPSTNRSVGSLLALRRYPLPWDPHGSAESDKLLHQAGLMYLSRLGVFHYTDQNRNLPWDRESRTDGLAVQSAESSKDSALTLLRRVVTVMRSYKKLA